MQFNEISKDQGSLVKNMAIFSCRESAQMRIMSKQRIHGCLGEELSAYYRLTAIPDLDRGYLRTLRKNYTIESLLSNMCKAVEILANSHNGLAKASLKQYQESYKLRFNQSKLNQLKLSKPTTLRQTKLLKYSLLLNQNSGDGRYRNTGKTRCFSGPRESFQNDETLKPTDRIERQSFKPNKSDIRFPLFSQQKHHSKSIIADIFRSHNKNNKYHHDQKQIILGLKCGSVNLEFESKNNEPSQPQMKGLLSKPRSSLSGNDGWNPEEFVGYTRASEVTQRLDVIKYRKEHRRLLRKLLKR